jgi:hypothetical protein
MMSSTSYKVNFYEREVSIMFSNEEKERLQEAVNGKLEQLPELKRRVTKIKITKASSGSVRFRVHLYKDDSITNSLRIDVSDPLFENCKIMVYQGSGIIRTKGTGLKWRLFAKDNLSDCFNCINALRSGLL